MNNSVENVSLSSIFVKNVLDLYKDNAPLQKELFNLTQGYDLSSTSAMQFVPMQLYNDMCSYIEIEVGISNARKLGRKIGETAYQFMIANKLINENPTPLQLMKALKIIASSVIRDPENRGWEILEKGNKHIVMRRTQTFNGTIQFEMLNELLHRSGVLSPKVEYLNKESEGAEFDDYKLSWVNI